MSVEQLEMEILKLPLHVRAKLAERLIASLDDDPSIDESWVQLAAQRYEQVKQGQMGSTRAGDVIAQLRNSTGKK